MVFLYFDSLNPQGESQIFCLSTPSIESSFEALSLLVAGGCRLLRLKLRVDRGKTMHLPIEAFDGKSMLDDLKGLQRQWEEALTLPDNNSN